MDGYPYSTNEETELSNVQQFTIPPRSPEPGDLLATARMANLHHMPGKQSFLLSQYITSESDSIQCSGKLLLIDHSSFRS